MKMSEDNRESRRDDLVKLSSTSIPNNFTLVSVTTSWLLSVQFDECIYDSYRKMMILPKRGRGGGMGRNEGEEKTETNLMTRCYLYTDQWKETLEREMTQYECLNSALLRIGRQLLRFASPNKKA